MPQPKILEQAKAFIASNQLAEVRKLVKSTTEIPTSLTVGEIIKAATQYAQYDLVEELCTMKNINSPEPSAVGEMLYTLYSHGHLEKFKSICAKSLVAPKQHAIRKIFESAINNQPPQWDFAEYILFSGMMDKPETTEDQTKLQKVMDLTFHNVFIYRHSKGELLEKIITMTDDYKLSQKTLNDKLIAAVTSSDFKNFKVLCEKAVTKPDTKTKIKALIKAMGSGDTPQWDFIEYILFSDILDKPEAAEDQEQLQKAIDLAFHNAFIYRHSKDELLEKIITMIGDYQLSQKAINDKMIDTVTFSDFKNFKVLCEKAVTKPDTKTKIKALIKAMGSGDTPQWDFIEYILFSDILDKPKAAEDQEQLQKAIDLAFHNAFIYRHSKGKLLGKIITMTGDYQLSQKAINDKMIAAVTSSDFKNFKVLCEKAVTKPDTKTKIKALIKAMGSGDTPQWDFIEYILFSDILDKPEAAEDQEQLQKAIDLAFHNAFIYRHSKDELLGKIITMTGDYQLSQKAINDKLIAAVTYHDFKNFKVLCEKAVTKSDTKTMTEALNKATGTYDTPQWDFIVYIVLLNTHYKPETSAVDNAIKKAAIYNEWDRVKTIYTTLADKSNKPSQSTLEYVLERAVLNNQLIIVKDICNLPADSYPRKPAMNTAFMAAASVGHLDIVRFFSESVTKNKPPVDEAFIAAVKAQQLEVVRYFSENSTTKPTADAYAKAFLIAVQYHHRDVSIVKYFCQLTSEHKPTRELVGKGLQIAAKGNFKLIAEYLFSDDNPIKPELADINKAFIAAAMHGALDIIQYFYSLKGHYQLEQVTIENAILAASTQDTLISANIIKFLLIDNPRTIAPLTLAKAFVQAITVKAAGSVEYFVTQKDMLGLDLKIFNKELLEAINGSKGQQILRYINQMDSMSSILDETVQKKLIQDREGTISAQVIVKPATIQKAVAPQPTTAQTTKPSTPTHRVMPPVTTRPSQKPVAPQPATAQTTKPLTPTHEVTLPVTTGSSENLFAILSQISADNDLATVTSVCLLVNADKPKAKDISDALEATSDPKVKKCLKSAQKFQELYQHIAALKLHGDALQQQDDELSKHSGSAAVEFANILIPIVDTYKEAFFTKGAIKTAQQQFASTLKAGFDSMGEHRAKWKMHLANIILAASVIGLLINYLVSGHLFFSNTKRQDKVQTIMDDLDVLESNNDEQDKTVIVKK